MRATKRRRFTYPLCRFSLRSSRSSQPLSVVSAGSEQVHFKMSKALDELVSVGDGGGGGGGGVASEVVAVMFPTGESSSNPPPPPRQKQYPPVQDPYNPNLSPSQLRSVTYALTGPPLTLIHGPPGTGKTTSLVEIILHLVSEGKKVLVAAPSNAAVDNLAARVGRTCGGEGRRRGNRRSRKAAARAGKGEGREMPRPKVLRLGHPSRVSAETQVYSLQSRVAEHDGTELVADVRREIAGHLKTLESGRAKWEEKRAARGELKLLRREVRSGKEGKPRATA